MSDFERSELERLQRQLMELRDRAARARVHLALGQLWRGQGRDEPARVHFREALALSPTLAEARRALSRLRPAEAPAAAAPRRRSWRSLLRR